MATPLPLPDLPPAAAAPGHGRFSPRQWWISFAELIFGGFVVIAHNVYHLVPNEVPILFVAALISFHLRDGGLRSIGFRKPASWSITIAIALAAAAVRILLG